MNKTIISVIAVLILVTGGFLLLNMGDETDTNQSQQNATENTEQVEQAVNNNQQQEEVSQDTGTQVASASGLGYVDYSDTVLEEAGDSSKVLFFHASWCSVCNFYEGQIEDQGVPDNATIVKVDFDKESELKKQYGVNVQSTFVLLDSDGNVEKTWPFAQGLTDIQDLYNQI